MTWPPMALGDLAGLAPVVLGLLAVVMRLAEHGLIMEVRAGQDLSRAGRWLVEALSVGAQVAIVAAGVCLAMLWGAR